MGNRVHLDDVNNVRKEPLRILVVDDDLLSRMLIARLLRQREHTVLLARDGQEALSFVQLHPAFDIILMDMRMPGMGGLEATRRIRALPGDVRETVIIGLTADVSPDVQSACDDAGVTHLMSKPFRNSALLEAITRYTSSPIHPMVGERPSSSETPTRGQAGGVNGASSPV